MPTCQEMSSIKPRAMIDSIASIGCATQYLVGRLLSLIRKHTRRLQRSVAMNNLPSRFGWLHPRVALATMITLALALFMPAARPATAGITPNVSTVSKTALENVDGNGCSLYEALQATFNGAPYHECNAGPDANIIIFSGAAAGGTINLVNLTLKDAHTSGGGAAILDLNRGTINALGVSFENNIAEGDGGAINSNGTVNIAGSNFVGNKAQGIANGGNNPGTGYGGAINMSGSDKLKLALTNFNGNVADKGGGGIFSSNTSTEISDVIFSGNIVNGTGSNDKAPQGGGAILNSGSTQLNIVRTAFNGNLAPTSNGGALYNKISATSTISETAFNGNIAGSPGNSGQGGAIYNQGGTIDVAQVTFLNNAVAPGDGGAITNDRHGTITIANSSFTANAALQGNGGALKNTNSRQGGPTSTVVARNVTFSANAALNSSGHGGAIFNDAGHSVTLGNTIVDTGVGDTCTGTIASL